MQSLVGFYFIYFSELIWQKWATQCKFKLIILVTVALQSVTDNKQLYGKGFKLKETHEPIFRLKLTSDRQQAIASQTPLWHGPWSE